MSDSRKPDFDVAVLHKGSGMKGRIGAAWQQADGSIQIVLNPAVNLQQDGQLLVTLFKKQEGGFRQPEIRIRLVSRACAADLTASSETGRWNK